jgi:hypothetical protein
MDFMDVMDRMDCGPRRQASASPAAGPKGFTNRGGQALDLGLTGIGLTRSRPQRGQIS